MIWFSVEGAHNMFRGPIFESWNEILLLGIGLQFMVIIQKYTGKFFKNFLHIFEKNASNENNK